MLKTLIAHGPRGRIVLADSITKVAAEDVGAIVVSASHGGSSSGEFALAVPLSLAVFNDAGGGKDDAGFSALPMLEARGVAACTVAHTSARIGDSQDMWDHAVISHVNAQAAALGLAPGQPLRGALLQLIGL